MGKTAITGNYGDNIRSDCQMELHLTRKGGIRVELESKVGVLYGRQIRQLLKEIFDFFGIKHALVRVKDSGALDFVLAARMEAAIKKLIPSEKEFLLPQKPETLYHSNREARRYTRLYLPGNAPKMMINAGLQKPDGIILDLEDSVAPGKKEEARLLVRNALREVDFYGAERMVRINQVPSGLGDLQYVVPHNVQVILIPKCEDARQLNQVNEMIRQIGPRDPAGEVYLIPILESAMGIENAFTIACAASNVIALAIGLEDLTSDLGVERTKKGTESFYARTKVVNACKAAGINAVDSVFSDVADEEGLIEAVRESKSLGFSGMGCIHPRQIQTILNGFLPGRDEILKAMKIVLAYEEAQAAGQGVVALGTKMIDAPVVKRAMRIIREAVDAGLIPATWREEHE